MPRKADSTHANAVHGALEAFQAAAEGDIDPPDCVRLREGDWPFWRAVLRARARSEWNENDLITAGNMARCMADIEDVQAELDVEGRVLENAKGTPVMNPKFAILEQLSRRHMALTRLLQMQASISGQASEMAKKRQAEKKAREVHDSLQAEQDEAASLLA